jgi:hypothetical protein
VSIKVEENSKDSKSRQSTKKVMDVIVTNNQMLEKYAMESDLKIDSELKSPSNALSSHESFSGVEMASDRGQDYHEESL